MGAQPRTSRIKNSGGGAQQSVLTALQGNSDVFWSLRTTRIKCSINHTCILNKLISIIAYWLYNNQLVCAYLNSTGRGPRLFWKGLSSIKLFLTFKIVNKMHNWNCHYFWGRRRLKLNKMPPRDKGLDMTILTLILGKISSLTIYEHKTDWLTPAENLPLYLV